MSNEKKEQAQPFDDRDYRRGYHHAVERITCWYPELSPYADEVELWKEGDVSKMECPPDRPPQQKKDADDLELDDLLITKTADSWFVVHRSKFDGEEDRTILGASRNKEIALTAALLHCFKAAKTMQKQIEDVGHIFGEEMHIEYLGVCADGFSYLRWDKWNSRWWPSVK